MAGLTETLPIVARLFTALAAGVTGFALAASLLLLTASSYGAGPIEGWSLIALLVAVPAGAVALMPFSARLFCFAVGLLAISGTSFMDVGGADNSAAFIPFAALCLAVAAVVAEVRVRASLRLVRPNGRDGEALH